MHSDRAGALVGNRYVLLETAGQGGMAHVWQAHDLLLRRPVALKRILPALACHEMVHTMFQDEGTIQGLLSHRHLVGVVEQGSDAHGPFLAMEWVEGTTARTWLHAHRRLPVDAVVQFGRDLFAGLDAMHSGAACVGRRLPVIHRDLAPTNVLVGRDGVARIADFGLARSLGHARTQPRGTTRGKPGYLPPEVLHGGVHGTRGDVYAAGVILWELMMGHRIFAEFPHSSPERMRALLHSPRPSLAPLRPDAPEALCALVDALLSRDPAQRPRDAATARAELDGLATEGRARLRAAVRSVCRQRARMERLGEVLAPAQPPPLPKRAAESARARA